MKLQDALWYDKTPAITSCGSQGIFCSIHYFETYIVFYWLTFNDPAPQAAFSRSRNLLPTGNKLYRVTRSRYGFALC